MEDKWSLNSGRPSDTLAAISKLTVEANVAGFDFAEEFAERKELERGLLRLHAEAGRVLVFLLLAIVHILHYLAIFIIRY